MQPKVFFHDSRDIEFLKALGPIQLVVTSPPYNLGKDYSQYSDLKEWSDYVDYMTPVFEGLADIMIPDGKLCIVIGDARNRRDADGRSCVYPTHSLFLEQIVPKWAFSFLGEIVWDKGVQTVNASGGGRFLGSYPYPTSPWLRWSHEFILVFRRKGKSRTVRPQRKMRSKITEEDWKEMVTGIWRGISGAGSEGAKYCAFPLEIPKRLIKMYSFKEDTVLDPFCGTGTTGQAAVELEREFIGVDLDVGLREIILSKIPTVQFS